MIRKSGFGQERHDGQTESQEDDITNDEASVSLLPVFFFSGPALDNDDNGSVYQENTYQQLQDHHTSLWFAPLLFVYLGYKKAI